MTGITTTSKPFQLTLAIIKPHIISAPHALQGIRETILANKFYIVRTKRHSLTLDEVKEFYAEHTNRFYFKRLVTFMSSGPCDLHILAKVNAILEWRQLMGPTKSYQAHYSHPSSIRGRWGLSDTRNAAHGSDSPESVQREIGILFPEFSEEHWLKEEKHHFENGTVYFDTERFIHRIKDQSCQIDPTVNADGPQAG
ncbi:unnamed protein product [Bemisia tabaci]|uniref:Nucleoside diphosphate kinase n=1 Tax=Bemisia tabaci TaxID=7038 RepID=A0A9P0AD60_BEMTA|nr:unnamed protein product [Bemisia tabaci]